MRQQKKKKPPFATFAKAKRRRCQERRKTADLQVYQRFDSFTCSTHALFFSFIMFFFCVCVSKGRLGNVFEGLKKLAETCFRKVHSEYTKKKNRKRGLLYIHRAATLAAAMTPKNRARHSVPQMAAAICSVVLTGHLPYIYDALARSYKRLSLLRVSACQTLAYIEVVRCIRRGEPSQADGIHVRRSHKHFHDIPSLPGLQYTQDATFLLGQGTQVYRRRCS
jgi:hypothetical protein